LSTDHAVGFTQEQLRAFHGAPVDPFFPTASPLRLLFVGINPGLWTAAVNAHFARRGNRFWPALHRAGITPSLHDVSKGMTAAALSELEDAGIGITNIVNRASARADELTTAELVAGGRALTETVADRGPRVVAILGLTAARSAFAPRRFEHAGQQNGGLAGAELWVLPNPSGLNAHETLASLAERYRAAAVAAGVPVRPE
jgi:double-stranded uracil-DNA glycosylase